MNNPCPQCPWRTANHGKRHFGGFYSKANLTRLWNQVRGGGAPQSCHLTDPSHADHIKAGCSQDAQARECPGSVILILRELRSMANAGDEPNIIDVQAIDAYLKRRRKGLKKTGILYWLVSRYHMGGVPVLGGPKLPEVDEADPEIDLPDYLKEAP
jgi:hypothetical protein